MRLVPGKDYGKCIDMAVTEFLQTVTEAGGEYQFYLPNIIRRDFTKLQAMGRIEGKLPDTIPPRIFLRNAFWQGYQFITEIDGELYSLNGSFGGSDDGEQALDANYEPRFITVANPYIGAGGFSGIIKLDDGVLIRTDPEMMGPRRIMQPYQFMEAESMMSLSMASIMTRLMSIFNVRDDNGMEAVNAFITDLRRGKFAAIRTSPPNDASDLVTSEISEWMTTQPFATAGSATIQKTNIEYHQYLFGRKWGEVGLRAAYNMKRESLSSAEIGIDDAANLPYMYIVERCINDGLQRAHEKYPDRIDAKFVLDSGWLEEKKEVDAIERQADGGDVGAGGNSEPDTGGTVAGDTGADPGDDV